MNTIRVTDEGKKILLRVIERELKRLNTLPIPTGKEVAEDKIFLRSLKESL